MNKLQPISFTHRLFFIVLSARFRINQRNGGFHDAHVYKRATKRLSASLFICSLCVGFQLSGARGVCVCASLSNWNIRAAARGAASSPLFFPFSDHGPRHTEFHHQHLRVGKTSLALDADSPSTQNRAAHWPSRACSALASLQTRFSNYIRLFSGW